MPEVRVNNAKTFYKVTGQGEPALLLHGVPDSANVWDKVTPLIQHQYRCYAPDLPGIYRSDKPDGFRFDFDSYADHIDAMVTALDLPTPITLIAHDWGAIYGMLWACKYPHKVKRVVAGDFPFSHLYRWHEWARMWRTPGLGELSMLGMNWPLFRWEFRRSTRRMDEETMHDCYSTAPKMMSTRWNVLRMYRSAAPYRFNRWTSLQKKLADQVPVDLVWGEDDPYVPTYEARLMHAQSVTIIPGCGHWPPVEAPEEYASIVLNRSTV